MPAAIIAALWAASLAVLSIGPSEPISLAIAGSTALLASALAIIVAVARGRRTPTMLMVRAMRRWVTGSGGAALWQMAFGPRGSHFVRLRRAPQGLEGDMLGAALAAMPGVQVVRVDADGALIHMLNDRPGLLAEIRGLEKSEAEHTRSALGKLPNTQKFARFPGSRPASARLESALNARAGQAAASPQAPA